tara:strand:+ start:574 stop:789 length:216 start_codon:yes stop_codon:yes gene_type:complete
MPQVGKQKFPYTSAGAQQAQKHAKATGQKVNMSGYKKGGKVKKKKGGAVKKKYHHGGRVMGGQKKPKNQKC